MMKQQIMKAIFAFGAIVVVMLGTAFFLRISLRPPLTDSAAVQSPPTDSAPSQEIEVKLSTERKTYYEGIPVFIKIVARSRTDRTFALRQRSSDIIDRSSFQIFVADGDEDFEVVEPMEQALRATRTVPIEPHSKIGTIHPICFYNTMYKNDFDRFLFKAPGKYRLKVLLRTFILTPERSSPAPPPERKSLRRPWRKFESNECKIRILSSPASERTAYKEYVRIFSITAKDRVASTEDRIARMKAFIPTYPNLAYTAYIKWRLIDTIDFEDSFLRGTKQEKQELAKWVKDIYEYSKGMANDLRVDSLYWLAFYSLLVKQRDQLTSDDLSKAKQYLMTINEEFPWSRRHREALDVIEDINEELQKIGSRPQ